MNKRYAYRDGLTAFSLGTLVYLALQLILSFAITAVEKGSAGYWIILAVCNAVIGVAAFAYAKLSKRDFVSAASLNVAPHWTHVLWGLFITFGLLNAMIPLNNWICDLFQLMGLKRPSVDLPMQIAPLIIVASVIPAVSEELLFRGTVGNALSHGTTSPWKGILISGALFSLFHMNPAQTVHQFALGCLLTLLVYRSGSVWTAVIIHLFNNVTTVLLAYFVEDTGFYTQNAVWIFLGGIAICAAAFAGYLFTSKVNDNTVYFESSEQNDQNPRESELNGNTAPFAGGTATFIIAVAVCAALWIVTLLS